LPSGLVWTVPIPDGAIVRSDDGRRLDVDVRDVPVIDATPAEIPATVTFRMSWRGRGPSRHLGRGSSVPATDPAAFIGRLFSARVRGTFAGASGSFAFQSRRCLKTLFAEVGTEQSGALLSETVRCDACAGSGPAGPGLNGGW
jgi:hypothetical protein